jgi:hypothetical protein
VESGESLKTPFLTRTEITQQEVERLREAADRMIELQRLAQKPDKASDFEAEVARIEQNLAQSIADLEVVPEAPETEEHVADVQPVVTPEKVAHVEVPEILKNRMAQNKQKK